MAKRESSTSMPWATFSNCIDMVNSLPTETDIEKGAWNSVEHLVVANHDGSDHALAQTLQRHFHDVQVVGLRIEVERVIAATPEAAVLKRGVEHVVAIPVDRLLTLVSELPLLEHLEYAVKTGVA